MPKSYTSHSFSFSSPSLPSPPPLPRYIVAADGNDAVRFACPITGQLFNGKGRFVLHRPSGYVVSERSVKEVPAVVEELVGCKYGAADIIPINPTGEEAGKLREELLAARDVAKAARKDKKRLASENGGKADSVSVTDGAAAIGIGASHAGNSNGVSHFKSNGNGKGASVTTGESIQAAKKSRIAELMPAHADPTVWNSLFSKKDDGATNTGDFLTRGSRGYVA
jgi:hypothetical protein